MTSCNVAVSYGLELKLDVNRALYTVRVLYEMIMNICHSSLHREALFLNSRRRGQRREGVIFITQLVGVVDLWLSNQDC